MVLQNASSDIKNAMASTDGLAPTSIQWPDWMPRTVFSQDGMDQIGDILVVVFLRGAADGLNMVVPHTEEAYYRARPTINIARPDDTSVYRTDRVLDLDGRFGFHPSLNPLKPIWDLGHLAIVHACGAPDDSHSHFRAMELMERGLADLSGPASGWINRHLASYPTGNGSPLRGVGVGEMVPRSLQGSVPISALRSISDFHLNGDSRSAATFASCLAALYKSDDELRVTGQETLRILSTIEALDPSSYRPGSGAFYPETEFGTGMQQIAMLTKAQVGLEVAAIDLGGWDTHFAQGRTEGQMPGLMENLADGLSAFYEDMIDHMERISVVVMSEFGRRVSENASLGTDHGHGGVMFLMGGGVVGGQIHGDWPGIDEGQLFGPGDLAVTTDYRAVLAEICAKRLRNTAIGEIFPGFTPSQHGFVR